ncbi:hypothetical protein ID852_16315 [Xenorhabdus sp. 42]|uniref:Toxin CptA n=1 Tax=Xenorhabdus szentirmaii TaxID=290112 RepID=A0AAW3YSX3_9GAMM|nr:MULTISPECIES: protein YgfX [Xenorhabdus]MBD2779993.1 hypothetical protein [Xenorhabdus sp. 38]MBD2801202.1 hypothetical protein [Xenorhabdus sp. M]MBD2822216.1 hypothetical protein [Xenorhabdus sp. 42]
MALWHCKLSVSRHTCLFSTGAHGGVAVAAALWGLWSVNDIYFWFPVFSVILMSWAWSQKRIRRCQGQLVLYKGNKVLWQKAEWNITQPPWFCRHGMLITFRAYGHDNEQAERRYRQRPGISSATVTLWIASDSLSSGAWRHLNQLMRQYPDIR